MNPLRKQLKRVINRIPYVAELRRQTREQGRYPAGHYYSPIPSRNEVTAALATKRTPSRLAGIDLRRAEQLQLLEQLSAFYSEMPFPFEKSDGCRYYFNQIWFCQSDAIMLYSLIRALGITRIIEVGSGYSSAAMLDTLEKFGPGSFDVTFIEPYPDRLKSLVDLNTTPRVTLIEKKIQEIDLDLFTTLRSGDLLFIDSSHVVKYQSDLYVLLFDVLPTLPIGVYVHFHDIFYPFEYEDEWLQEGRYWNECYFLRAFLSGNKDWEIVLFNHYANLEFGDYIQSHMPLCRQNFGGGLYLRKVG
jgi:predicted O-methyltransferase YrrM